MRGNTYADTPRISGKIMRANPGAGPKIIPNPATDPINVSYPVVIPLNGCPLTYDDKFCNGIKIHNSTLNLEFAVNILANKTKADFHDKACELNLTYVYNGLLNTKFGITSIDY